MNIKTVYSIGDRVNLNFHDPNYSDEIGIIDGLQISVNSPCNVEITYWYKVDNRLGCFTVTEPGKVCNEYDAIEYHPLD
jgi:hypothetical protein